MAADGVRQARSDHYKLMLALRFRSSRGAPHRIVEAAQLALGARIHVPHAAYNDMCLVVQVEAVGHQLVEIDLRRSFAAAIARPAIGAAAAFTAAVSGTALASLIRPSAAAILARRPVVAAAALFGLLFLYFSHADSFLRMSFQPSALSLSSLPPGGPIPSLLAPTEAV